MAKKLFPSSPPAPGTKYAALTAHKMGDDATETQMRNLDVPQARTVKASPDPQPGLGERLVKKFGPARRLLGALDDIGK